MWFHTSPYQWTAEKFVELQTEQYAACNGQSDTHCDILPPESTFESPTCTLALFLNGIDLVHKLCNFHFLPNGTKTDIFELKSGKVIVKNVPNITYKCGRKVHIHKGCSL